MSDMWNNFTAPMPDGYSPPEGTVKALNTPQDRDCMSEGEEMGTEAMDD